MFRSLIAITALVISVSAIAERYLVIDLTSMDYFWLNFNGSDEKRVGPVTFNYNSAYGARRYIGTNDGQPAFTGYLSVKTFTVKRDDGSTVMEGTREKIARKQDSIEGYFYDTSGSQAGQFIATTDYDSRNTELHYICGSGLAKERYFCAEHVLRRDLGTCRVKTFPGKFSHLNKESCENELKSWQADEKAREEAWKCSPENKSATLSSRLNDGCLEPSNSFKTAQQDPLMYNKCLVNWLEASRIETFPLGHRKTTQSIHPLPSSMFSVFKDRTEYEFASTVEDTILNLYFNEDVPEDLRYLVNEAAYSCVIDPFSLPPEGFWPIPWAKPSWEAGNEATD